MRKLSVKSALGLVTTMRGNITNCMVFLEFLMVTQIILPISL